MINFANSQYLLLLLLIPFFFVIQKIVLVLRRRRIRKFGDESLVNQLMPSYAKGKVWVRLSVFSVGFPYRYQSRCTTDISAVSRRIRHWHA